MPPLRKKKIYIYIYPNNKGITERTMFFFLVPKAFLEGYKTKVLQLPICGKFSTLPSTLEFHITFSIH